MPILWLKFSQEATLPAQLTPEEQAALEKIYNPHDRKSIWSQALITLGIKFKTDEALLRFHNGQPYVNWSLMVDLLSCGWITVMPAETATGFVYQSRKAFFSLPRLLARQWRIAQYIEKKLLPKNPLPQDNTAQLVESTALGIALQALLLRLPRHTPQDFAGWLVAPDKAPRSVRQTIMQIQALQKRRTQLSASWHHIFPPRTVPQTDNMPQLPESFWDEPQAQDPTSETIVPDTPQTHEWTGLPVCAGQVTGRAMVVWRSSDMAAINDAVFPILIFPRARPETVEMFGMAAALLYAEGGTLSHACTVAREQGIPCITALGADFLYQIETAQENGKPAWLAIDGMTGLVRLVETKS